LAAHGFVGGRWGSCRRFITAAHARQHLHLLTLETNAHTYMPTNNAHTLTHSRSHACTQTHIQIYTYNTHTRTHTRAHANTHAPTYTNVCTHAHRPPPPAGRRRALWRGRPRRRAVARVLLVPPPRGRAARGRDPVRRQPRLWDARVLGRLGAGRRVTAYVDVQPRTFLRTVSRSL
jgi:hypothetical protein